MPGTLALFTSYPIRVPRHGGQIRAHEIAKAYENAGWRVVPIAVYEPEAFGGRDVGPDDIPLPHEARQFAGRDVPFIADLTGGTYAASDRVFNKILNSLPTTLIAVHAEQPWLWPVVERLKSVAPHITTIYGSENIEAQLKRSLLFQYGLEASDVIAAIDSLEGLAAAKADLVLATTEADAAELQRHGPRRTLLIRNGVSPREPIAGRVARWRQQLPAQPWLLYVASGYPPNFTHIRELFDGALGCFPPGSRLVVAGSVSDHVHRELIAHRSRFVTLNQSRLQLLGDVSDDDLAAIRALAHGFVLPIKMGSGSNLKTAEALYYGGFVIGTSVALRGFEKFLGHPGLTIADNATEFRRAIVDALRSEKPEGDRNNRFQLTWEFVLADMVTMVGKLVSRH